MQRNTDWQSFSDLKPVVAEFLPVFVGFAVGRYAVTIGGAYAKGTSDADSDIDFRLFADDFAVTYDEMRDALSEPKSRWTENGIRVDDFWPRRIADVDEALERWTNGQIQTEEKVWTIWGYHLLTDIGNQMVIEDRFGIIERWRGKLQVYPPRLRQALLDKHLGSLRYWRDDYHYRNKVKRKDIVFLAGLTARIVHDLFQVLFALNEVYFPGDGLNLELAEGFAHRPADLAARIRAVLYPGPSEGVYEEQRRELMCLIDDAETLVARVQNCPG